MPLMIRFTKMHGLGNDYVYLDLVRSTELDVDTYNWAEMAIQISDRHRGVGADGLILIVPPTAQSNIPNGAGVRMIMFNADGSRGEMCGNGVRCVCKYAVDHGLITANQQSMLVETDAGVLSLDFEKENTTKRVNQVTVDMGQPTFDFQSIGVTESHLKPAEGLKIATDFPAVSSYEIAMDVQQTQQTIDVILVGTGNPHLITFVESARELAEIDLEMYGPLIEHHAAFHNRINAHFVHVHNPNEMTMRTWERGSGITQACGTGASAVCAAGVLAGKTERESLIHLPGGDLHLRWDRDSNHLFMAGPAAEIYSGEWPIL